jgi:hypothetical protein
MARRSPQAIRANEIYRKPPVPHSMPVSQGWSGRNGARFDNEAKIFPLWQKQPAMAVTWFTSPGQDSE